MSRPLRVLAVFPAGVLGGAEHWLLQLLGATERLDVTALVLADGDLIDVLRHRAIPTQVIPTGPHPGDALPAVAALHAHLRSAACDVVLLNGVKAAAVALPVTALLGVPSVWVRHDHSFGAALARPLGLLATQVIATDPQLLPAIGRSDTVVIVPPSPVEPVPRAQARQRLGIDPNDLVLTVLGRLVDYKGNDDAIRALTHPQAAGWTLTVIGQDDPAAPGETARLTALVRHLNLHDRVTFTGHIPDAGQLISAADALAVLTKPVAGRSPKAEGFGITALEAARAAVPVIAVAGSPPAERLAGHGAITIPAADPAALAHALHTLRDPIVRAQMGTAAQAATADHPSAQQCAATLVGVLTQAAARPGAGLDAPATSVIVTVRNEAASIGPLLNTVLSQLRTVDELLVVDGGSTDGTTTMLRAAAATEPRLTVLERPGAGISQGRNLAVAAARNPTIACTDAGCTPSPHWLTELTSGFADTNPPDLITGTYTVTSARTRWWSTALAAVGYPDPTEARRATPLVRLYGALFGRTFDPALPTGRSIAFTQSAHRRAGGFPEHLATGEDITFGQRIAHHGRAVLAADAEVNWQQRATLAANLRMYRSYGRGDGLTGSPLLLTRNAARALAYPTGTLLLTRGNTTTRALTALAAAGYLSLPTARTARRSPRAVPAVPLMAALRDGAKAWGCLQGLRHRHGNPT